MNRAAENYAFKNENIVKGLFDLANDFYSENVRAFNYKILQCLGYDGIIKQHVNGTNHYVAFFPHQIKSVTNNIFGQDDNRINF